MRPTRIRDFEIIGTFTNSAIRTTEDGNPATLYQVRFSGYDKSRNQIWYLESYNMYSGEIKFVKINSSSKTSVVAVGKDKMAKYTTNGRIIESDTEFLIELSLTKIGYFTFTVKKKGL